MVRRFTSKGLKEQEKVNSSRQMLIQDINAWQDDGEIPGKTIDMNTHRLVCVCVCVMGHNLSGLYGVFVIDPQGSHSLWVWWSLCPILPSPCYKGNLPVPLNTGRASRSLVFRTFPVGRHQSWFCGQD